MNDNLTSKVIDKFFNDVPNILVKHQLDSYNEFFFQGIQRIIKEKNPIKIMKNQDPVTNKFKLK